MTAVTEIEKNNPPFKSHSEALLLIEEVDGITLSAFKYALRLMVSLKNDTITNIQYINLSNELNSRIIKYE
jgi:hypothetical protein